MKIQPMNEPYGCENGWQECWLCDATAFAVVNDDGDIVELTDTKEQAEAWIKENAQ